MTDLPSDPLRDTSLARLAQRVRAGDLRAADLVEVYLARIAALEPKLQAFEHVDAAAARRDAAEIDRRRAAGAPLGPLAGLPVAVKDLFVVDGMPTTGGSALDLSAMLPVREGPFVAALRAAGAVILGKTRTVEFAFGATGINHIRGTPWNPADMSVHRIPGGSSSGSAVAVAGGLAAFAIGSDTGGSVRIPAALCGTFGLKTSRGLWPTDGVLPLAPTFDTVGLLTRSAADADFLFAALQGPGSTVRPPAPSELRLVLPTGYDSPSEPAVAAAFAAAVEALSAAGVALGEVAMAEATERAGIFPVVLAAELMERFGRARFDAERARIDPLVATRMERALSTAPSEYRAAVQRTRDLAAIMEDRLSGFDGWIAPTTAILAPEVSAFEDLDRALDLTLGITCNTQPANLFDQCAVTVPLPVDGLPVGFQIAAPAGRDARLLAIARTLEQVLGGGRPPASSDLSEVRAHHA